MSDAPPSPNPLPTTERTLQDNIRHDRAYLAGLRAGWNLGIVNASDEFNSRVNSLVSELTQASTPTTEWVTQGWQPIEKAKIGIDCIAAKIKDGVIIEAHKAHLTPEGKWAIHGFPARFYGPTDFMPLPPLPGQKHE